MKKLLLLSILSYNLSLITALAQPGTFDNDFDADGFSIFPVSGNTSSSKGVVIDQNGKIVMAGVSGTDPNFIFSIARLNPDGSLDNTFSTDGINTTAIMDNSTCNALALQPDGKIVTAGYSSYNSPVYDWFALARYNTDGSLDITFDNDGIVFNFFGDNDDRANDLIIQPDGKIIAAGSSYDVTTQSDFALARFNSDGSLDNSFSFDGKVTTDFNSGDDAINSLVLQPDGKILAAGSSLDGTIAFAVSRYNTDGTLDNTFSTDGRASFPTVSAVSTVNKMLLLPDGKIILVGELYNTNRDIIIMRINADGSADNTFGTNGVVTHDPAGDNEYAYAAALQPDGKILVAGSYIVGWASLKMFVARYNADGSVDNSFGTNGLLPSPSGYTGFFKSLTLQNDLKIIAVGSYFSSIEEFVAVRILSGLNLGVLEFSENPSALVYPNPVNENTVLEFELAGNENLNISIYDVLGKQVKLICENKLFNSGKHALNINATELASGQYTLVIENTKGKSVTQLVK
jgi:uncharacterized delta-60 repeat protein